MKQLVCFLILYANVIATGTCNPSKRFIVSTSKEQILLVDEAPPLSNGLILHLLLTFVEYVLFWTVFSFLIFLIEAGVLFFTIQASTDMNV